MWMLLPSLFFFQLRPTEQYFKALDSVVPVLPITADVFLYFGYYSVLLSQCHSQCNVWYPISL